MKWDLNSGHAGVSWAKTVCDCLRGMSQWQLVCQSRKLAGSLNEAKSPLALQVKKSDSIIHDVGADTDWQGTPYHHDFLCLVDYVCVKDFLRLALAVTFGGRVAIDGFFGILCSVLLGE